MKLNQAVTNELAHIEDWGFSFAKTGTPSFWIKWILDNQVADNGEPIEVYSIRYVNDNTLENFLKEMSIFGWTGRNIAELDKTDEPYYDLKDKQAVITTEMEEWEGKLRCKVKWINDPNYQPFQKLEKTKMSELSKMYSGKIAAFRAKNGNTVKAPVAKTASNPEPTLTEGQKEVAKAAARGEITF